MQNQKLQHTVVIVEKKDGGGKELAELLDAGNIVLHANAMQDAIVYVLARLQEEKPPVIETPGGIITP